MVFQTSFHVKWEPRQYSQYKDKARSWKILGSIPNCSKKQFFCSTSGMAIRPTWSPILQVPDVTSLGVKQPGHTVHHSPPSSAAVNNEWIYTSTPHLCLPGLDTENFTTCCTNEARDILISFYTFDIP
jgi:hypothetical protein